MKDVSRSGVLILWVAWIITESAHLALPTILDCADFPASRVKHLPGFLEGCLAMSWFLPLPFRKPLGVLLACRS